MIKAISFPFRRLAGLRISLVLLTAGTLSTQAATLTRTSNDLFIGFRALSGSTGDDKTYLLNIGQYSKFSTTNFSLNNINTPGLGNFATDLSTQFGSDWQSSGNVLWGIIGAQIVNGGALYASELRPDATTQSSPFPVLTDAGVRNGVRANIGLGLDGYNGGNSTANSNLGFFQNSSLANGWAAQVTSAGTDFGDQSQWGSVEGLAASLLDLYRITGSTVTTPGYFGISSAGTISFTAVPEPSTYVLAVLGAATVFHTIRRRKRLMTTQA